MNRNLVLALLPLLPGLATASDWKISGSIENSLFLSGDVPPAFLEFDDDVLFNPRASLTLDYQPDPRFFFHTTLRIDRGFDPGTHPDGQARLDELIFRYRPFGNPSLGIQIGKFPSVIGNWIPTHHFYEDPFILAPLPYSAINGVHLKNPANNSPIAIETRSNLSGATIHRAKENWSSIIWGPAYSNGISVSRSTEHFDYAFEIKNASLGSQPTEWDFGEGDFRTPTISGRIGYRPSAAWDLGFSASHGHYLNANISDILPAGADRDDFEQTLIGFDLRWAQDNWLVSGEIFYTSYDTLHEDFHSLSYYLQARYKAAPGVWLAGRLGQTLSNEVSVPSGGKAPWSPDYLRSEFALGWRITPELLLKTQYAYTYVSNDLSEPSQHLTAFSLGWRF